MRARDFEKTCRLDGSAAGDLEEKSTTKAACIEVLRRWKLEVGPVSRMAARLSGEAPWKRFEQELEELGRGRAAAVWLDASAHLRAAGQPVTAASLAVAMMALGDFKILGSMPRRRPQSPQRMFRRMPVRQMQSLNANSGGEQDPR